MELKINSSEDEALVIPKDTLDYLKRRFPEDKLYDPTSTVEDLRVTQGQLLVIRELQRIFDNQRRS